jgi:hypothetical protein
MSSNEGNGKGEYEGFVSESPLAEDMLEVAAWASEPLIKALPEGAVLGVAMKVPRSLLTRIKNFVDRAMDIPYETLNTVLMIQPEDEDEPAMALPIMVTQFEGMSARPIWTYFNVADIAEEGALPDLEDALRGEAPLMLSFVDSRLRELAVPIFDYSDLQTTVGAAVELYKAGPWDAEIAHETIRELMDLRKERGMHTIADLTAFMIEIGQGPDA